MVIMQKISYYLVNYKGFMGTEVFTKCTVLKHNIMLTCQCNVDPLTPQFYKAKFGFKVIFIFFLFFL